MARADCLRCGRQTDREGQCDAPECMKAYRITNRTSGHCLGVYQGDSPAAAADAMHCDAGYDSSAAAADACGTTVEDLIADLIIEPLPDTMDTLNQAEGALGRVREAASPEAARKAVAELFSQLADEFRESASECERNWQDKSAGKPWDALARQLERYVKLIDR